MLCSFVVLTRKAGSGRRVGVVSNTGEAARGVEEPGEGSGVQTWGPRIKIVGVTRREECDREVVPL